MKNVLALVALSLALSLSACTKKEEAVPANEPNAAPVEGTTTTPPPSDVSAPVKEMEGSTATVTSSETTTTSAPTAAPAAHSGAVNNPMATPSVGNTAPGGKGVGTSGAATPGSEGK